MINTLTLTFDCSFYYLQHNPHERHLQRQAITEKRAIRTIRTMIKIIHHLSWHLPSLQVRWAPPQSSENTQSPPFQSSSAFSSNFLSKSSKSEFKKKKDLQNNVKLVFYFSSKTLEEIFQNFRRIGKVEWYKIFSSVYFIGLYNRKLTIIIVVVSSCLGK